MNTKRAIHILATYHSVFTSLLFLLYGYMIVTYGYIPRYGILCIYGGCSLVLITLAWLTERPVMLTILSTTGSVIFLLAYVLVVAGHASEFDWFRFRVIVVMSCVNWYAITRIARDKDCGSPFPLLFRHMNTQFLLRYIVQVIVFFIGIIPGWMMPFGFYHTFGHAFLPVPKVYWGTTHEEAVVWTLFVCCGFSAVWLPACVSTGLFFRGTGGISRVLASGFLGLAAGAALCMLYTSQPGGWSFILK